MTVDVITLRLLLSGLILHAFCREGVDSEYNRPHGRVGLQESAGWQPDRARPA